MLSTRKTLAVLLAALVVGSSFAIAGAASSHTTGNEPTDDTTSDLTVVSLSAPDSAAPGSTIDVTATLENPGPDETTETVEFRIEGTVIDRQTVTVDSDEQTTVTFTANTTGLEPGDYLHGVLTETDGAFAALTVSESFTVEDLDAPETATEGENISVEATVNNPNEDNATQQVEFRFAGGLLGQESITLGPDETTNVTFNASLDGVAEGTYVHGVLTRDSGQLALLDVEAADEADTTATVNFSDQESEGTSVVVDSATLPDGGFIVIHNSSLLDGNVIGSVIGVSEPLSPGAQENVTVPLFTVPGGPNATELTESDTLIAMPHLDTNGNDTYDFVRSEGTEDGPYVDNGSAVTDAANVTIESTDADETNETEMPDSEPSDDEETVVVPADEEESDSETSDEEMNETGTPTDETTMQQVPVPF